jgi:hypothetical protein
MSSNYLDSSTRQKVLIPTGYRAIVKEDYRQARQNQTVAWDMSRRQSGKEMTQKLINDHNNEGRDRAQVVGGSAFLCAAHLLMMAERSRTRRSSGSS